MEEHVNVKTGAAKPHCIAQEPKTRKSYSARQKIEAVKEARQIGVAKAARSLTIEETTLRTWYEAAKKVKFEPKKVAEELATAKRGRRELLNADEKKELASEIDLQRDPKLGLEVKANRVAATARGLQIFHAKGHPLEKNGGNKTFSRIFPISYYSQQGAAGEKKMGLFFLLQWFLLSCLFFTVLFSPSTIIKVQCNKKHACTWCTTAYWLAKSPNHGIEPENSGFYSSCTLSQDWQEA